MTAIYRVGERVDGLYDENTDEMWYPGRVRCVHQGGNAEDVTFEVLYDDGEVEMAVRPQYLRQHVTGTICVGTRVLGRYDGGNEFYSGQISDVQENGKYTIAYDDGEVEEDVQIEHIVEPKEEEEAEEPAENEEKVPSSTADDAAPHPPEQQEEDVEMEEPQKFHEENERDEPSEKVFYSSKRDPHEPAHRTEEDTEVSSNAERVYIIDSLELLEKRLGDAASAKSVLSTLVKHMRAYPQVTADLVHERGGERLIIESLKFHQSHAVIQCYGFVLLRRLCFLCVKSTHYLLRNGVVELVIQAMNEFAEDAILQASACGALAVFTRVHSGLNSLIEFQVAQLVLATLIYHKTYSVHTRQVHYYGCEVLLELCELDDLQTLNLLCGEQDEEFTGDMSPTSLLLFLLRQGLSLDDKKACCAVGSLLMCLAASGRRAAASVLSLNGLSELSTVMARYPTEPSIQKYSAAASKQIALCSVRQSPTKRIKDTATEILREAEFLEHTPIAKPLTKRSVPRRTAGTGKRKNVPSSGYGASSHPRGAAYSSSKAYRNTQAFSNVASPYRQSSTGDMNAYNYAPQPPSNLVILDGGFGADSGLNSVHKRRKSREERQNELLEAYGVQGAPTSFNSRPYGTKRRQLRAHLSSAESTWATPHQHLPSSIKPLSSRSSHVDHGSAYSQRDGRWGYEDEDSHNSIYNPEVRQPKRKKNSQTAFQVKVESDNQLLVSRESQRSHLSPQRLGATTKRAARARQKRISAANHASMTARSNNPSSESLNEFATHLFQDSAARGGSSYTASSRLTPREKEEIRERERLSFAEKLHKMIDKAKSSLANGNTTPMSVDTVHRPHKSSAGSGTARKTRQVSVKFSEDTRPKAKKTRTTTSSTPKQRKDLSPQEAVETRPAKPTKRAAASSDALSTPVVSRPKPVVSRAAVTPKTSTDPKPRPAAKAVKEIDKQVAEKPKESVVEFKPVDISTVITAPEATEPERDVDSAATPAEEVTVPAETKSTEQVEPSCDDTAKMEKDAVLATDADVEEKEVVLHTGDLATDGTTDKSAESIPIEAEDVHTAAEMPLAKEEEEALETAVATVPSEDTQQSSEPPLVELSAASEDQPSEATAAVDAMYGDAFNDFDDNGGEDEEMTADAEDAQTPVAKTLEPLTDMQMSKSGEALYDDGYDEFDEDEPAQTEEAEEASAAAIAEAKEGEEPTDTIADPPVEGPVAELPGVMDKQVAKEEAPVAAAEEEDTAASADRGGEGEKPQLEADEKADTVGGTPSSGEDPFVSNSEEEQEPVSLNTDLVAEPGDPEDAVADAKTDIDIPPAKDGHVAPDGGSDELEAKTTSSTSAMEPAETEDPRNDTQPTAQPEENSSMASAPTEDVSMEPATEEATANPEQPQQEEDRSKEETSTDAQPDEPLTNDVTEPSPDQEEEAKQLAADGSVASVHSIAYDEDNFDEEADKEAKPSEKVEANPVAEVAVKVANQQQQQAEASDNTEAGAVVTTPDALNEEEEESKTLAADSSEVSVQSAAYGDEVFGDGHQEAQADDTEDKALQEEPSSAEVLAEDATIETPPESVAPADDAAAAPENGENVKLAEVAADEKAPVAPSETYGDEDFDNPEQDNVGEEAIDPSVQETVDKPSAVLQQEDIEATPESDGVADTPLAVAENEVPNAEAQEETQRAQEPVAAESDEYKDDGQVDNGDGDAVSAAAAAYDVDNFDDEEPQQEEKLSEAEGGSAAAPVDELVEVADQKEQEGETSDNARAGETPTDIATDHLESEAAPPVAAHEEEESPLQAEAYDDDEFDKGDEHEEAAPSAKTEDATFVPNEEVSRGEDSDVPVSGQPSDEVVSAETDSTPPKAESETNAHPEQSASEDADVPDVATETPSEDAGEQVESPAKDKVDNSVEMAPSESERQGDTSEERPSDGDDPTSAGDKPDVGSDSEKAAGIDRTEIVPAPEAQSELPIGAEDQPDQSEEYPPDEAFDDDSPESNPAPVVEAGASVEPSVDATQEEVDATREEAQYEDAEFDDAEDDATALKDGESEKEHDGVSEEATPADTASPDDTPPAQDEGTGPVNGDSEEPATLEEAVDVPGTIQEDEDAGETSEAVPDTIEDAAAGADKEPTRDPTAAVIDDPPSSVGQDTNDVATPETEIKDEPRAASSDATAYDEDFPDDVSAEANENGTDDSRTVSTEKEGVGKNDTPAEAAIPADESKATSDEHVEDSAQLSEDIDAAPDVPSTDEQYEDGFDEENTAPGVDTLNSTSAVGSTAEADADTIDPERSSVPETAEGDVAFRDEQMHQDEAANDELDMKPADVKADVANTAEAAPTEPTAEVEQVESETVESENIEPEAGMDEIVDPETVEPKESVQTKAVDSGTVQSEVDPVAILPKAAEPDAVESVAVESENTVDSDSVPKPAEESLISDVVPEEAAAPRPDEEDSHAEPLESAEPVVSDAVESPAMETAIEPAVAVQIDAYHPSSIEERDAATKTTEDAVETKDGAADSSLGEDPVERASPTADVPATEVSAGDTLDEPTQSKVESKPDAVAKESADESQIPSEVVEKEVVDGPVSDKTTSEVGETTDPTEETQQGQEPDFTEDEAPADEPPIASPDDSASTEKNGGRSVTIEASPEPVSQAEAPMAEVEQVTKATEGNSEPTQDTLRDPIEAEDQYDDDDGYNEFIDQDNESKAPIDGPSVEIPAPAAPVATDAPATEDEYENERNEEFENEEEYENDDNEAAAETPRAHPVTPPATLVEPPVSAREQEIEEEEDAPDETYADDHDEYNNEYEDDDAAAATKSSPPIEDKPSAQAETSADEYEDDNEEEYADDEIEDTSPPKPAPTNKSDDEMEEELGYESDEGYAASNG
ncbi:hypothetical protein GN244_ATG09247 [Phytophthora infestans]|uniref:Tudor domain-containing protein n=1 Tax=Phytophthora infestans TaxID=4787 RepID=A0A833SRK0_PHYIN|nr:hypothetical protein GN244_ATG09247 [Phytophthora infestans]KAF4128890.1 hypothetical protein GN958_ATG21951 [Phytophthora infestans]